jgi:FMN phosphatase YigB (HAD superfamily)
MPVRAVVLDIGEVLVDETRIWSEWADWLGVPRGTLLMTLGGLIERGDAYRELFQLFQPGFDLRQARRARAAAGRPDGVRPEDVYPDAVPALVRLVELGYVVGVAGNQPASIEPLIRDLGVPLDLVAASERWGVAKPAPAFFERIAAELGLPAGEIAYVGDRLDNDVGPATAAGMRAIHLRRGAWAMLQVGAGPAPGAAVTIDDLGQLPDAVARLA